MFPNTATLKFRMTLVVGLLALLGAGLVALVSLVLVERQMKAIVGDQEAALLASAAAYIDHDLAAKKMLLKLLGEQLPAEVLRSPAALQPWLEGHATLRDEFFNVAVFDTAGGLVANLNDRRLLGSINVAARAYFRDTATFREGVISEPFSSVLSGKPVILVTEPVFRADGKLLYVLAGAIDLQRPSFFGLIDALKPGKNGYLFMLTSDGVIVHHPDRSRILKNVKEEAGGMAPSTLAAMNGFEGWLDGTTKQGVQAMIAYKRLARTNWIIGAVYPLDEALAPLIAMRAKALLASAAVAALSGLIGWLAISRLLRPLGALRRHVANISAGGGDIKVFDVVRRDEFGELSRAFFALSRQREEAEAHLNDIARTDPLTGIGNRRMFEEALPAAMQRSERAKASLGLAYLDIDHFKAINDSYGHGVGDMVLVEFANRLKQSVRATDTVARLAGDEFVIIFENLGDGVQPSVLGDKIIESMRAPFVCGSELVAVSASVGIALCGAGLATADNYLQTADQALYEAKSAGRATYRIRPVLSEAS